MEKHSIKILMIFLLTSCLSLQAQVTTSSWVSFSTLPADSVIANPVRAIWSDFTGRMWWGTAMGLYRQASDNAAVRYIYDDSSYNQKSRNNILAGAATPNGNVYTGSLLGLTLHEDTSFTNDSLISFPILPDSAVDFIAADSSNANQIWCGGIVGLWAYTDSVGGFFTTNSGLGGLTIYDVAIDSIGSVWVATNNGVTRLWGGFHINYTTAESGLNDNLVHSIAVAGNDLSVWFGSDNGLIQFDGDTTWTDWSDSLPSRRVRSIVYNAADTSLWVATDSGLGAYRPNRPYPISTWRKYYPGNTGDSLPQFNLFSLEADTAGRIWVGHSTGVTRLKEN